MFSEAVLLTSATCALKSGLWHCSRAPVGCARILLARIACAIGGRSEAVRVSLGVDSGSVRGRFGLRSGFVRTPFRPSVPTSTYLPFRSGSTGMDSLHLEGCTCHLKVSVRSASAHPRLRRCVLSIAWLAALPVARHLSCAQICIMDGAELVSRLLKLRLERAQQRCLCSETSSASHVRPSVFSRARNLLQNCQRLVRNAKLLQ